MAVERFSASTVDVGSTTGVPFLYSDGELPMLDEVTLEQPIEEVLLTREAFDAPIAPEVMTQLAQEKPELLAYCQRTGERIVHAEKVPLVFPDRLLPPEELLQLLSHAPNPSEIGLHGMPVAAGVTPENKDVKEFNLFDAEFYRDGRVISHAFLDTHPKLLWATIHTGARYQGTAYDKASNAEPGKIFHENRRPDDPQRKLISERLGWHWPYMGASETTPDFIFDVGVYHEQQEQARLAWEQDGIYNPLAFEPNILDQVVTDDEERPITYKDGSVKTIRDAVKEAASNLIRHTTQTIENPEGLLEFKRTSLTGIENQAWKDSGDSYMHRDGTVANHERGVASIEVQVKAYNAYLSLIQLFPEHADYFATQAAHLQHLLDTVFWTTDERGTFPILGTDRDDDGKLRKLDVLTSNAAYLLPLLTGTEYKDKRESLVRAMFSEVMWSPAGLRTLASDEVRYHPDGYHDGSVWPFDNQNFADGLDTVGLHGLATIVSQKTIEVVENNNLYPEKLSGGEMAEINQWDVDIVGKDGQKRRTAQPPQLLQGFTLAAYKKAKQREALIRQGLFPDHALTPEDKAFEEEILKELAQRSEAALASTAYFAAA